MLGHIPVAMYAEKERDHKFIKFHACSITGLTDIVIQQNAQNDFISMIIFSSSFDQYLDCAETEMGEKERRLIDID